MPGSRSHFARRFGYCAHGVSPESAILPQGWEERLVRLESENIKGWIGLCLDPHDLAASKMTAGREKDTALVKAMLVHGITSPEVLEERLQTMPVQAEQIERMLA